LRNQAPKEWKVLTITSPALGAMARTLSFISWAALLVKVTARMERGFTPWRSTRCAILVVITRVLPDPAPASISRGEPVWTTAARCSGFRASKYAGSSLTGGPFEVDAVAPFDENRTAGPRLHAAPHHDKPVHVGSLEVGTSKRQLLSF